MEQGQSMVLIPAYKPDERLVDLVRRLLADGLPALVVNDGSGETFDAIFEGVRAQGVTVLEHPQNRGKGAALRTGIEHIMREEGVSVITADADGQHTPEDIRKVADALSEHRDAMILGMRSKKAMPPRSRAGNTITALVFGLLTGLWVQDTQTGLRGLPAASLRPFSVLEGDRYEYEMNVLLYARHARIRVVSVPIDTIYIDDNRGSHFHALRDGFRIYALLFQQVLRFMGSSLAAGVVDWGVYMLLQGLYPERLFLSVGVSRLLSAGINFAINQHMVFNVRRRWGAFVSYLALVAFILFANFFLVYHFRRLGLGVMSSKLLADFLLFFVNYNIQKNVIFRMTPRE